MKRNISVFLTMVIMLSVLLMFTGCSKEKGSVGSADPAGQADKNDELILAVGNEPSDGFNPITGWGRYGSPLFQSTLFKRDSNLEVVNDLAAGYEVSGDGLTWTVALRDDVKFSDGEPLTADDVVFTYKSAMESGSVVDLTVLETVRARDEYTVEFILKQPHSAFISVLVSTGIVPAHAYGDDYADKPVGSGPFMLVQWDKGQQLIVEANPYYYEGEPYFKKLTFLFLEEDAAFAAAKAGDIHIASIPSALAEQKVPGMRLVNLESVDNRGILFPYVKSGEKTEEGKPIGNDVTADLAIRRAINVALDREELVKGALNGYGTPAYSVCDKMPWWNPDNVIKDGDFEEAKRILADGGWEDADGDGILEKEGLKAAFNMVYPASDQTRQSLALAAADMIKPLGIDITVEGKSWDAIYDVQHFCAVLFGWGSYDPREMYNLYSSENAGNGSFNAGFYKNPRVDDYMNKALAATTEAEALEYWKKAQWDGETGFSGKGDAPWAWLVNLGHLYLVDENLEIGIHKIQPHGHGWPITDTIMEWRWKQ